MEEIEEDVVRTADGAVLSALGQGCGMVTTPVTTTDVGGDVDEVNAWQLIDPVREQYMGGLAIQGLDGMPDDANFEGSSLDSMNPLTAHDIPGMSVDEPARLGLPPESSHAGRSSGIRHMSESLTMATPKFFWETDPFLMTIFGGSGQSRDVVTGPELKRPAMGVIDVDTLGEEPPIVQAMKRRLAKPIPLHARVLKHIGAKDAETKRMSLFSDWSTLIAIDVESFSIANMLRKEGISRGGIINAVGACLGPKATSTIHKRYCALSKFVRWTFGHGAQTFPVAERVAYDYLVDLREDPKTSPTAGQSFLESVHFAAIMLGLKNDFAEVGEQRIKGVAEELARTGLELQQAQPLTVDQVKRLETLTCVADNLADTLTLGGLLIAMYGCARHSDILRAKNMIWDVDKDEFDFSSLEPQGYLELQVLCHKTARSVKMKRTFLPVVCPLVSISGEPWYAAWSQARQAMGLEIEGEVICPILCRFDEEGRPVSQELTSSEAGAILREALQIPGAPPHKIRSHSLKCTTLSWASRAGVDLPTRRILGHHLDPGAKAAEIYGRDTISAAVRKMTDLLGMIKDGRFVPDATRSGRFKNLVKVVQSVPVTEPVDVRLANEDPESSIESPEDSGSSTDLDVTDSDEEAGYGEKRALTALSFVDLRPCIEKLSDDFRTWRHIQSGVQHLQEMDSEKFLCGRRVTDKYVLTDQGLLLEISTCQTCVKTKPARAAHPDDEGREQSNAAGSR